MQGLRTLRHGIFGALMAASLAGLPFVTHAQTGSPSAQASLQAFARANAAVVGLKTKIAEGAPSTETLGAQRVGSGVVIDASGLVLTIGYLMMEAQTIEVVTHDNKTYPAKAVGYDLATGFGLVQTLVPMRDVEAVSLGKSAELQPGEPVLAVVGPQDEKSDSDLSMIRLVGKRPFSGYWEYHIEGAVFTSPPIGNHSGAPLFNQRGELVGIGSLLVGDALGGNRRLPGNMFVPVDLLTPILAELRSTGETKLSHRPWIGLTSSEQFGRVQVVRVSNDSPAKAAGIDTGDLILAVDDNKVDSLESFYKKLWDRPHPEGEIALTVVQGAEVKKIVVKPVDRIRTMRKASGI